jgi:hypothetical protein
MKPLLRRIFCLALIALALCACSAKPKVVSVPQVFIQELNVSANKVNARILLHNFSNVEMTFSELNYQLSFAGKPVTHARIPLDLLVPMDSPESTSVTLNLNADGLKLVQGAQAFGYQISGTITSSKPSRVFEFNYDGKLSPTPGKPGAWR